MASYYFIISFTISERNNATNEIKYNTANFCEGREVTSISTQQYDVIGVLNKFNQT